jgi:hypothetical protein
VDRRRLLRRLDEAWVGFNESYAGLSDAQLTTAGVTGAWSVRDIIAHVTTWEEEALTHLPLILEGGTPPRYSVRYGGIDAFNARMTEQKRGLSLAEVRAQLVSTHRRLVALIQAIPAVQCADTRFRRRLRLDTYGHYPLHADAIRQWRRHGDACEGSVPWRQRHGMGHEAAQEAEIERPADDLEDAGRAGATGRLLLDVLADHHDGDRGVVLP